MSKSRALGTKLYINSTLIGGLKSINGVEISQDTIDLTDLNSTDGYREFDRGFKDAGEVSGSGFLDGADEGQAAAYTALDSDSAVACKIVFPPKINKQWSFNAIVSKFSTGAELEDAISFDMSLKISGKPTLEAIPVSNSTPAEE